MGLEGVRPEACRHPLTLVDWWTVPYAYNRWCLCRGQFSLWADEEASLNCHLYDLDDEIRPCNTPLGLRNTPINLTFVYIS